MEVALFKETVFQLGASFHKLLGSQQSTKNAMARYINFDLYFTSDLAKGLKLSGVTTQLAPNENIGPLTVVVAIGEDSTPDGSVVGYLQVTPFTRTIRRIFGAQLPSADFKLCLNVRSLNGPDHRIMTPAVSRHYFTLANLNSKLRRVQFTPNYGDWSLGEWSKTSAWTLLISMQMIVAMEPKMDVALQQPLPWFTRKLFDDEIFPDVTIIAGNWAEVKFHRSILAAHSPVFETMFKTEMVEAETRTVELPDMSEDCLRALRKYFYVGDLQLALEDSEISFELFRTAHKYDIPHLEKSMERVLITMENDDISADMAVRLFVFVLGLEYPGLKKKAVSIMKMRFDELEGLRSYNKLFKKNAKAGKELCKCFALDFN